MQILRAEPVAIEVERAIIALRDMEEVCAMPTYEYRCNHCGEVFERQQHIAEHATAHPRCPKCKSEDVQPQLSDFYAKTAKKA